MWASLSAGCSVAQKNDLLDRKAEIRSQDFRLEQRISLIMKLDDDTLWSAEVGKGRR